MSLVAVGVSTAVVGGAASYYGSKKNAEAIEDGAELSAAVQGRALDASLAINRPTQRLGNSAQRQLAAIFGLPDPGEINFGRVDSAASGGPDVGIPGLTTGQQATSEDIHTIYRSVLGRDPDPDGFQYYANSGLSAAQIVEATRGSDEYKAKLEAGTLPQSELGGGQEFIGGSATNPAGFATSLSDLVENNEAFRFTRDQGEQALSRGAAARGLNASGSALKDLARFNQGNASTFAQQLVVNPLMQLAGFGQQANAQSQGAISGTATNLSNIIGGAADARGSAYQSGFNAIGNTANDIGGAFALRELIKRQPVGYGATGGLI